MLTWTNRRVQGTTDGAYTVCDYLPPAPALGAWPLRSLGDSASDLFCAYASFLGIGRRSSRSFTAGAHRYIFLLLKGSVPAKKNEDRARTPDPFVLVASSPQPPSRSALCLLLPRLKNKGHAALFSGACVRS